MKPLFKQQAIKQPAPIADETPTTPKVEVTAENFLEHPDTPPDLLQSFIGNKITQPELSEEDLSQLELAASHPATPAESLSQLYSKLFPAPTAPDTPDVATTAAAVPPPAPIDEDEWDVPDVVQNILKNPAVPTSVAEDFLRRSAGRVDTNRVLRARTVLSQRDDISPELLEEQARLDIQGKFKDLTWSDYDRQETYANLRPEFYLQLLSERAELEKPLPYTTPEQQESQEYTEAERQRTRQLKRLDTVLYSGLGNTKRHTPETIGQAIEFYATTGRTVTDYDEDPMARMLGELARNPVTTKQQLESLGQLGESQASYSILSGIVSNPSVDPTLLSKYSAPLFLANSGLAQWEQSELQETALANPAMSADMRRAFVDANAGSTDSYFQRDSTRALLRNPAITEDDIMHLYKTWSEPTTKDLIVTDARTPIPIIESYYQSDPSTHRARVLLGRDQLPSAILKDIVSKQRNIKVAVDALKHPSVNMDVLNAALKRKAKGVQDAAAQHPLVARDLFTKKLYARQLDVSAFLYDSKRREVVGQLDPDMYQFIDENYSLSTKWVSAAPTGRPDPETRERVRVAGALALDTQAPPELRQRNRDNVLGLLRRNAEQVWTTPEHYERLDPAQPFMHEEVPALEAGVKILREAGDEGVYQQFASQLGTLAILFSAKKTGYSAEVIRTAYHTLERSGQKWDDSYYENLLHRGDVPRDVLDRIWHAHPDKIAKWIDPGYTYGWRQVADEHNTLLDRWYSDLPVEQRTKAFEQFFADQYNASDLDTDQNNAGVKSILISSSAPPELRIQAFNLLPDDQLPLSRHAVRSISDLGDDSVRHRLADQLLGRGVSDSQSRYDAEDKIRRAVDIYAQRDLTKPDVAQQFLAAVVHNIHVSDSVVSDACSYLFDFSHSGPERTGNQQERYQRMLSERAALVKGLADVSTDVRPRPLSAFVSSLFTKIPRGTIPGESETELPRQIFDALLARHTTLSEPSEGEVVAWQRFRDDLASLLRHAGGEMRAWRVAVAKESGIPVSSSDFFDFLLSEPFSLAAYDSMDDDLYAELLFKSGLISDQKVLSEVLPGGRIRDASVVSSVLSSDSVPKETKIQLVRTLLDGQEILNLSLTSDIANILRRDSLDLLHKGFTEEIPINDWLALTKNALMVPADVPAERHIDVIWTSLHPVLNELAEFADTRRISGAIPRLHRTSKQIFAAIFDQLGELVPDSDTLFQLRSKMIEIGQQERLTTQAQRTTVLRAQLQHISQQRNASALREVIRIFGVNGRSRESKEIVKSMAKLLRTPTPPAERGMFNVILEASTDSTTAPELRLAALEHASTLPLETFIGSTDGIFINYLRVGRLLLQHHAHSEAASHAAERFLEHLGMNVLSDKLDSLSEWAQKAYVHVLMDALGPRGLEGEGNFTPLLTSAQQRSLIQRLPDTWAAASTVLAHRESALSHDFVNDADNLADLASGWKLALFGNSAGILEAPAASILINRLLQFGSLDNLQLAITGGLGMDSDEMDNWEIRLLRNVLHSDAVTDTQILSLVRMYDASNVNVFPLLADSVDPIYNRDTTLRMTTAVNFTLDTVQRLLDQEDWGKLPDAMNIMSEMRVVWRSQAFKDTEDLGIQWIDQLDRIGAQLVDFATHVEGPATISSYLSHFITLAAHAVDHQEGCTSEQSLKLLELITHASDAMKVLGDQASAKEQAAVQDMLVEWSKKANLSTTQWTTLFNTQPGTVVLLSTATVPIVRELFDQIPHQYLTQTADLAPEYPILLEGLIKRVSKTTQDEAGNLEYLAIATDTLDHLQRALGQWAAFSPEQRGIESDIAYIPRWSSAVRAVCAVAPQVFTQERIANIFDRLQGMEGISSASTLASEISETAQSILQTGAGGTRGLHYILNRMRMHWDGGFLSGTANAQALALAALSSPAIIDEEAADHVLSVAKRVVNVGEDEELPLSAWEAVVKNPATPRVMLVHALNTAQRLVKLRRYDDTFGGFVSRLLRHPKILQSEAMALALSAEGVFGPVELPKHHGEGFHPLLTNAEHGGRVFRSLEPSLPDLRGLPHSDRLIRQARYSRSRERLNQVLAVIPPEGITWSQFKQQFPKYRDWSEVKQLFVSHANRPVSPEHVAQEMQRYEGAVFHLTYSTWSGMQRHNPTSTENLVIQLNTSENMDKQLSADPKLWAFFQYVQKSANHVHEAGGGRMQAGGHPVTPHTAAWVRVDTKSGRNGWIIEELQSDFGASLRKQLQKVRQSFPDGVDIEGHHVSADEMEQYLHKISEVISGWYYAGLNAVEELARAQGVTTLYLHGLGVRAALSGFARQRDVPVWMQEMYYREPPKLGWKPIPYSEYPNWSAKLNGRVSKQRTNQCWTKSLTDKPIL